MKRSDLLLGFAVTVWVGGFWLAKGRMEQISWLFWILTPVLLGNWRQVLDFWRNGLQGSKGWWVLFGALIVWQFLITGLRGGQWWVGPGAGKDVWMLFVLVSGLAMVGRDDHCRAWFWRGVFVFGVLGVLASLVVFYSQVPIGEERFRICWRQWPGFNAVTSGIFAGMALMAGLIGDESGVRGWKVTTAAALAVLGFGVAASESRCALVALVAGSGWWLWFHRRLWHRLAWAGGGFVGYWLLVFGFSEETSSRLIERGSAGRLDIYQTYLSQIGGMDWIVGMGKVGMLPEDVLGWLVHHPHNAYLGQLIGYGIIGVLFMLATIIRGFRQVRHAPESAILVFGLVTLLFDGGMVFSLFAIARWEVLVVMVPLVVGMARIGQRGRANPKKPEESDCQYAET